MSLAERIFGRATVEVIEDARGWFADLFASADAIVRPAQAKTQQIRASATEWTNREIALGHNVESSFPLEVMAAITKVQRQSPAELEALYASKKPALDADTRRRCERLDSLYAQFVTEVVDYSDIFRLHRQFAEKCGMPAPASIAASGDAISEHALLTWRERVQRVLNPPAVQSARHSVSQTLWYWIERPHHVAIPHKASSLGGWRRGRHRLGTPVSRSCNRPRLFFRLDSRCFSAKY